jgi:hypothetical protein
VQRPAIVTFPVTVGLFFGGGIGGIGLASFVAPDSIAGNFIGLLALPLAFIAGMNLWLGFALLTALLHGIRRLLSRAPGSVPPLMGNRDVPPGAYSFVLAALATSAASGLVMAFLSTRLGFVATLALYLLVGLVYGMACWLLARSGFLPFGEE